jgi:hypothetical protein
VLESARVARRPFLLVAASVAAAALGAACNSLSGVDSFQVASRDGAATAEGDADATMYGDVAVVEEASDAGRDVADASVDTSSVEDSEAAAGDAALVDGPADAPVDTTAPDGSGDAARDSSSDAADGSVGAPDAADAGGDAGISCPGDMVHVLSPSPAPAYCVDATEVTNADYAAFLATSPAASSQPSYCSWNTSFTPTSGWPASTVPNHPVAFVDWCDAQAYCASVGKRLCGAIGGGTCAVAQSANASVSQWYNACSLGGTLTFSYGNTWQMICNDYWNSVGAAIDVGSDTSCVGGFSGLHDMTGNVWEWEDACTASTGSSDSCNMRGAGFDTKTTPDEHCGFWNGNARNATAANLGFRCCRD